MGSEKNEVTTLEQLIKERRVNQGELAEEVGVSRSTVSRWIKGTQEPSTKGFLRLCAKAKVSPKEMGRLMGYEVDDIPDDQPVMDDPWQN
jgi:transcriptional regulator with XRE-family HTH domain